MSNKDALMFPLIVSCAVFALYVVFQTFSKEYINLLLTGYSFFLGVLALSHLLSPIISFLVPASVPHVPYHIHFTRGERDQRTDIVNYKFTSYDVICVYISLCLGAWYLFKKHWIANNLFGIAFAINGVELLRPNNVVTGCILLCGLFLYDIFWVFGTNVMVTVAKSFEAPIKLVFPQDLLVNGLDASNFATLSLGDIVVLGIFIALLLRFDKSLKRGSEFYFRATFSTYILGLLATILVMHIFMHAQPALLYLVPACLGTPLALALLRGDIHALFNMPDRRSLLSIASGISEENPDLPEQLYTKMSPHDVPNGSTCGNESNNDKCSESAIRLEEPTYESVAECDYATMRRTGKRCPPPPLPPRLPFGTLKLGESWNSRMNTDAVTRRSALGSLPRCYSVSSTSDCKTKTLLKSRQAFSVFRKRLKSDSRIMAPTSEPAKENKHVETKKKKFDFIPTRDIFKNFKVSRKMKNLKIAPGSLSKAGETKSCEFLDETDHVTTARCPKSVEGLENESSDDFEADLSLEFNDDSVASLALPQEIVDLILRSEQMNKIRLKSEMSESDYMPMSPICPPTPIEYHYIAMSPGTNLA